MINRTLRENNHVATRYSFIFRVIKSAGRGVKMGAASVSRHVYAYDYVLREYFGISRVCNASLQSHLYIVYSRVTKLPTFLRKGLQL